MPHTLAEKILLAHCEADDVQPGNVVMVRCDVVMANDVSGPVAFRQLEKMGISEVFDLDRIPVTTTVDRGPLFVYTVRPDARDAVAPATRSILG